MKKMMVLVGLLALAVLVVSCTQGGTLAGEASGSKKIVAGDIKLAECPRLKNECGFQTSQPVFLSFEDLLTHYGSPDFRLTKTGAEICRDMGYSGCVMAESYNEIEYYASSDGTCATLQNDVRNNKLESCAWEPGPTGPCTTMSIPSVHAEPFLGDIYDSKEIWSVVCTR